jgi:hypothetical protein
LITYSDVCQAPEGIEKGAKGWKEMMTVGRIMGLFFSTNRKGKRDTEEKQKQCQKKQILCS